MKKTSSSKKPAKTSGDDAVAACVLAAIDAHNKSADKKRRVEKDLKAVLYGKDGRLDSLGLVNLIVAVEERVSRQFGAQVVLADSRAMSQKSSPFRTVGSLVAYVGQRIKEAGGR